MGQAKQRKAEILALKAAGLNKKGIVIFGAYYKDDADDGVSVEFATFKDPKPGFTKFFYNTMMKCVDAERKEYEAGRLTKEEVWSQLKEAIVEFNIKCFGTPVRPQRHHYQIDLMKCLDEINIIMTDIWLLTEIGEIQNDNFNGMNFGYVK
jgi:hypothetical protein